MSDMSTRSPLSSAPDHARHDALVVAQMVAGDALPAEQQARARQWLAVCPACGQLAADLATLSRVVAAEPIPPRRRDLRISPEQADAIRGSALTRALRRLALPQGRRLQPVAAGLLSIGLLFVVAGYVWPGSRAPQTPTEVQPATLDTSSDAARAHLPESIGQAAASPPQAALDHAAAEAAGEPQAMSKAQQVAGAARAPEPAASPAPDDAMTALGAAAADLAPADVVGADEAVPLQSQAQAGPSESAETGMVAATPATPQPSSGLGVESLFIALGLLSVISGLVLAVWLLFSRISRDPLLR
jgi:hypothetical protein